MKQEEFEIDENAIFVGYHGEGSDVVIPEGVTTIPNKFFFYAPLDCPPVVHCPDTLLTIWASTFDDCHNLVKFI